MVKSRTKRKEGRLLEEKNKELAKVESDIKKAQKQQDQQNANPEVEKTEETETETIPKKQKRTKDPKQKENIKLRKQEKKATKVTNNQPDEETEAKKLELSINYLAQFVTDKDNWKFNKNLQVYILSHLYHIDKFDEPSFENVLEYLKDSKGMARQKTLEEAKTLYEVPDEEEEETKDGEEEKKNNKKKDEKTKFQRERAFKILQALS